MAAPRFFPVAPLDPARGYTSPDVAPDPWTADRPADLDGRQPVGARLGYQGPDQGYALKLAELIRPAVRVSDGESVDDALVGITATALRRASLYGRAPVIHDLRVAQRLWGFADDAPPAELLAARGPLFVGLARGHRYDQVRALVDVVADDALRTTPDAAAPLRL